MCAPVAQLDRATGYEPVGREFDSLRAHHTFPDLLFPLELIQFPGLSILAGRAVAHQTELPAGFC